MAALLLAIPSTAAAAPAASSAPSSNELPAVGQIKATVLAATAPQGHGKASPALPTKFMHPDELAAAKVKAAAPQAAPSPPAGSTSPASAALFNGLNQPGLSAADEGSGATPPDSTGAIGPTRYVELVNQMIGVYDRSNLSLLSSTDLASFVGVPAGVTSTDPQIQWDPQANRWLYAEIGFATGNNYLVFGWTKTADPSDLAGGWCHYGVATGHNIEDYPKLGHDAHFLIVGTNVYDDGAGFPFITANIFAIPKPAANDSTCSSPVTATYFADATHLLKNTDGTLAFTPVPANASDSVTNDYIFGAHDVTLAPQSKVMLWHMTSQPNPVLVADGDISVPTFAIPASVPQPGTSYQVDSLDGRLTQAVAHFDPSVGAEAYWTQHTIAGSGGRSLVRWYEFAPSLASPIVQQGQISSATDFIWNAAISPSIVGSDAAIFYNRGSKTQLAVIGAQSRTSSTPAGTMDPGEVPLGTSSAADQENAFQGNCTSAACRWGDYSGASPDPANAGVVWGSNQLMGPVFLGYAQWTTRNFAITTGASAGPDFSLSAAPASQTVIVGNSTTYTVNINRTGGFAGTVALTTSGAPAGASATLNPTSTGGSSSTLTVTTSASTPPGSSVITITGTSGSLTRTATATLVVQPVPPPDYSLSAGPSSQTVTQGSGTSYAVTVTPISGFAGSVTLAAGGLPSGAGATFNPNPTGAGSTMSVTTSATTPAATYTLTITGLSGSLSHATSVTLVVQPPPDYSLSASPSSQTVTQGLGTTYSIGVTAIGGFAGSVMFSAGGLPGGAGATFSPNPTTTGSTLSVTTSASTVAGTYTLTITGASGSLSHSTSVTLVVQQAPDFSLSANPSTQTVTEGNGAGFNLSLTSSGGFAGSVTLSAGGLPSGASATFSPNPTSATSAMFVSTSATTPTGTYSLTVTGVSGSLSHTITVTLVVQPAPTPDYSLAASPSSQAVTQGQSVAYAVSVSPTAGFAGSVMLSATGLPTGAAATFSPNPAGASSTMAVTTSASTPFGTYVVTVTGVSGSLSHTTTVTLVVVGTCSTPTLTTSAPSPYASGSGPIQLTANGQCGGGTEYWFLYKDPSTGWHTISAYSSSNTALWNADYAAGGYVFEVDIRPIGSSAAWVAYYDLPFTLSGCGVPSLTPDVPSPQSPGTAVHWTATVSCTGTPQYLFYVRSPAGAWSIAQPWGASNTFTWSTPATDGAYLVQVNVRNAGANENPSGDNNTAVTYNVSSCNTPTLSTSAASPYISGSGPIQLTATGQCGGGTQYQFFYKDLSTGWHAIGAYGSSNTALWNADYRAGNYLLEADIRPLGSTAAWVAYYDLPFTLSGCATPTLTPDVPSPQSPGATVHWTASVSCSGTPQYEFQVRSAAGVWSVAQTWGLSSTFTWSSPAIDGSYVVEVDVRNAGANEDPYDSYTDVAYSLASCNTPTLTTSAPSPYASGSGPIQLTATGQCGGGTQFWFLYKDPSTGWHTIGSGYSSSNTAIWNADYRAGGYTFEVDIRPVGSTAAWVAYFDLPFTLSGCGMPTLTPDVPSPQSPGATVHWTASVSCSGTPQYEFQVRSAAGVWSVAQAWGSSSTFTWSSPPIDGSYVVEVDVRNAGANEDPWDSYTDVAYSLTSCSTPTLTTSAPSPYASGSGPIQLTATGQCGGGTEYWFLYKDPSTGWHTISGYSSSNTALWNADYRAGGYTFEVDIRPVGSSAAWVAYYDLPFTLSGCGAPTLTPDLAGPQPSGTTVHWTATVSCTGTPQYEFQVRSAAGVWSIAQPWGSSNTFTWTPPTSGGYVIEVLVRNTGANEDPYDSYIDVPYNLS
jgi:hypothetical protein